MANILNFLSDCVLRWMTMQVIMIDGEYVAIEVWPY